MNNFLKFKAPVVKEELFFVTWVRGVYGVRSGWDDVGEWWVT